MSRPIGVDPKGRLEMRNLLQRMRDDGRHGFYQQPLAGRVGNDL